MPGFNGNGVFVRTYNWVNDANNGINITASRVDTEDNGFATGLSTCITKDGQTTITANLPMANFKHTGVGDASARNQYASYGQLQDSIVNWVVAGGTADAITATYSPALTALLDGQLCYVRAGAANATATPTFSPNGLTAHTITKEGGQALVAGDIFGSGHELILKYKLASTRWELLNPATSTIPAASVTNSMLAGSIALTKLANQAANTVLVEQTGSSAPPTALALSASNILGRGSSGNIAPLTVDSTLTISGTTISVTNPALKRILGRAYTSTGAVTSTTTVIPLDDTIPQITEGAECLTLAYTPVSTTSKLRIEYGGNVSGPAGFGVLLCLFKDAGSDALAVSSGSCYQAGAMANVVGAYEVTSGSTSAATWRLRFGANNAGTSYNNGDTTAGGRLYGGTSLTYIMITELEA